MKKAPKTVTVEMSNGVGVKKKKKKNPAAMLRGELQIGGLKGANLKRCFETRSEEVNRRSTKGGGGPFFTMLRIKPRSKWIRW